MTEYNKLRVAVWYRAFPGDLNNNKTVDFRDFSLLASEWQQTKPELLADIDLNGTVDIFDLMRFSEDWLKTKD